ncbi:hypothetical protein PCCS19_33980 [Paenibacillus sp. CCS19]|uniref:hypothetical protein n=1 Tax=Paenibacillus sp. CCS19 TaxID=3158387 RepID=UPI0025623619|nr:hypothetical protein [Paenibacillus cellulosilyticus]GMK40342.1 hypothetical protein PCCS19_33980 [Paenibacillus cellulosilyticus]
MKHLKLRKLLLSAVMLPVILLSSGCSTSMSNVDIEPPTSGILHYLQQSSMANVSDNAYQVQVAAIDGTDRLLDGSNALSLRVLDPSGQPVSKFTEDMTKLMHLIIVNRDLSIFQHLHPEYRGDGSFETTADFPAGGEYLLIEEFVPDDQPITVTKQWVSVTGKESAEKRLQPGQGMVQTLGGITASVSIMPDLGSLRAGQMVMIEYHLADAKTGEPLQLEPYLGTAGHSVILNEEADQYVHVHAVTEMSNGSNVMFHTAFPAAGKYRIWGQFQYNGEVLTLPFDVEVQP